MDSRRFYGRLLATAGVLVTISAHAQTRYVNGIPSGARRSPVYVENAAADAEARMDDSVAGLQWMEPAAHDVSRYTVPMCINRVDVIDMQTRRRIAQDTILQGRVADTLSSAARGFGAACAARWTTQSVSSRDLRDYIRLLLTLGETREAMVAINRRLSEAPNDSNKASILLDAMDAAFTSHPVHIDFADSLTTRIVALGPKVNTWKVLAIRQYVDVLRHTTFDTARVLGKLERYRFLPMLRALSDTDRYVAGEAELTYSTVRRIADDFARLSCDSIFYRRARNEMAEVGEAWLPPSSVNPEPDSVRRGKDGPGLVGVYNHLWRLSGCEQMDTPLPPFSAVRWYVPGDTTSTPNAPTIARGRVTLILPVGRTNSGSDLLKVRLRRWYEQYAKEGLDIILVTTLQGYAWNSPPLEPQDEARVNAWYFHDMSQLSFPLAQLGPGERLFAQSMVGDNARYFLVGRDGRRVNHFYGMADDYGFALEAYLRQALGLPEQHD